MQMRPMILFIVRFKEWESVNCGGIVRKVSASAPVRTPELAEERDLGFPSCRSFITLVSLPFTAQSKTVFIRKQSYDRRLVSPAQ